MAVAKNHICSASFSVDFLFQISTKSAQLRSNCFMQADLSEVMVLICHVCFILFLFSPYAAKSRDSPVGVALGYGLDDRGYRVRFPEGAGNFFSSPPRPERLWGPPKPLIQWVPGALSLGVKRPGREADHSPPSSAENEWSYTSIPPIRLHGVVLS
jgi:hypothetical protein